MPTPRKSRYVMAYDISDNAKRAQLANRLLDFGVRIQKSVFEADLTRKEAKELLAMAEKYISVDDSFRLYPLCKSCAEGCERLGYSVDVLSCSLSIV